MKKSYKKISYSKSRIKSFKDLGKLTDLCMKVLIKNLYFRVLYEALSGADKEVRLNFFSNMTKENALKIRKHMSDCIPKSEVKAAQDFIIKCANGLDNVGKMHISFRRRKTECTIPTWPLNPLIGLNNKLAAIFNKSKASDLSTDKLISVLTAMAEISRTKGVLSLENLKVNSLLDEPLLKDGLSLVVNGEEPELIREILNNMKRSIISKFKRRQDIIIRAVRGFASRDDPKIVSRICKGL